MEFKLDYVLTICTLLCFLVSFTHILNGHVTKPVHLALIIAQKFLRLHCKWLYIHLCSLCQKEIYWGNCWLFNILLSNTVTSQWARWRLNHRRPDCLLSRLFRRGSKKTSKLRVIVLCEVDSPHKGPVTRKMFPFDDVIIQSHLKNKVQLYAMFQSALWHGCVIQLALWNKVKL